MSLHLEDQRYHDGVPRNPVPLPGFLAATALPFSIHLRAEWRDMAPRGSPFFHSRQLVLPLPSEEGKTYKRFNGFYLEAKAIIWP